MGSRVRDNPHLKVPRSEAFSFWTHAAGALLGVVGLGVLVGRADDLVARVSFVVYGVSLVLLFTSSALHHLPVAAADAKSRTSVFRRLDHAAIFVFIAGTYTPICVLVVPASVGLPLLAGVWLLAVTGVLLKVLKPTTPRWASVGLYLGLGWFVVVSPRPVLDALPVTALALLVAGGLTYTVGAIVYVLKRPDPFPRLVGYHGIWHVLVLAGAGLHYALILLYVPTSGTL